LIIESLISEDRTIFYNHFILVLLYQSLNQKTDYKLGSPRKSSGKPVRSLRPNSFFGDIII